ncbi:MAG: hypothetical protein WC291_09165, partial [Thermodesulfovibrionales bacterium]
MLTFNEEDFYSVDYESEKKKQKLYDPLGSYQEELLGRTRQLDSESPTGFNRKPKNYLAYTPEPKETSTESELAPMAMTSPANKEDYGWWRQESGYKDWLNSQNLDPNKMDDFAGNEMYTKYIAWKATNPEGLAHLGMDVANGLGSVIQSISDTVSKVPGLNKVVKPVGSVLQFIGNLFDAPRNILAGAWAAVGSGHADEAFGNMWDALKFSVGATQGNEEGKYFSWMDSQLRNLTDNAKRGMTDAEHKRYMDSDDFRQTKRLWQLGGMVLDMVLDPSWLIGAGEVKALKATKEIQLGKEFLNARVAMIAAKEGVESTLGAISPFLKTEKAYVKIADRINDFMRRSDKLIDWVKKDEKFASKIGLDTEMLKSGKMTNMDAMELILGKYQAMAKGDLKGFEYAMRFKVPFVNMAQGGARISPSIQPVVDAVRNKIGGWERGFLSVAGRVKERAQGRVTGVSEVNELMFRANKYVKDAFGDIGKGTDALAEEAKRIFNSPDEFNNALASIIQHDPDSPISMSVMIPRNGELKAESVFNLSKDMIEAVMGREGVKEVHGALKALFSGSKSRLSQEVAAGDKALQVMGFRGSIVRAIQEANPDDIEGMVNMASETVARAELPQVAAAPSSRFSFEHYSPVKGLTELKPEFHGTALAGSERATKYNYPKLFVPRTYLYKVGAKPEPRFGKLTKYTGEFEGKILRMDDPIKATLSKEAETILKRGKYTLNDSKARTEAFLRAAQKHGYGLVETPDGNAISLTSIALKPKVSPAVVAAHAANGGATFSIKTGENLVGKDLWSVSLFPERSKVIKGKKITEKQIEDFVTKNSDIFQNDNVSVGTWFDEASGQTYIDAVVTVGHDTAVALGGKYNQKAIFGLKDMVEEAVGGTGEALGQMPTVAERLDGLSSVAPVVSRAGQRGFEGTNYLYRDLTPEARAFLRPEMPQSDVMKMGAASLAPDRMIKIYIGTDTANVHLQEFLFTKPADLVSFRELLAADPERAFMKMNTAIRGLSKSDPERFIELTQLSDQFVGGKLLKMGEITPEMRAAGNVKPIVSQGSISLLNDLGKKGLIIEGYSGPIYQGGVIPIFEKIMNDEKMIEKVNSVEDIFKEGLYNGFLAPAGDAQQIADLASDMKVINSGIFRGFAVKDYLEKPLEAAMKGIMGVAEAELPHNWLVGHSMKALEMFNTWWKVNIYLKNPAAQFRNLGTNRLMMMGDGISPANIFSQEAKDGRKIHYYMSTIRKYQDAVVEGNTGKMSALKSRFLEMGREQVNFAGNKVAVNELAEKMIGLNVSATGFMGDMIEEAYRALPNAAGEAAKERGFVDKVLGGKYNILGKEDALAKKMGDFGRLVEQGMGRNEYFLTLVNQKGWSAERAAARVNEIMIDYGRISKTESSLRKYMVPFYTWQSRMIPQMLIKAIEQPAYFTKLTQFKNNMYNMLELDRNFAPY